MVSHPNPADLLTRLRAIWTAAEQLDLPVALWRLPHTHTVQGLVDVSGQAKQTRIDLEELSAGFALSPFLNPDGAQSLFLHADVQFTLEPTSGPGSPLLFRDHTPPLSDPVLQRRREHFLRLAASPAADVTTPDATPDAHDTRQADFENMVGKAIAAMQHGDFQKVVLSRTLTVAGRPGIVETYLRLARAYPLAFVSLVRVPGHGTWMGASPEVIVSTDRQGQFRTVALAGTQAYDPAVPLTEVMWKQKEIEEQALVSRYIINCFKKIRLREYEEDGPQTVVAGNLLHLSTDFRVDTHAVQFPQLGTVMLGLLHPTSAVCGMPKEPALDFIARHEPHRRDFYSGFLGPVNMDGETHLYVNLRCTQWLPGGIVFYAGAGITAGSVPEREWRETELKTQTMRRVIGV